MVNWGGVIMIKKLCCGEGPVASVTVTENENVPAVVGMPEIVPLVGVSPSPGGKEPKVIAQY